MAGSFSFLSPCVLPLIPGYLSYLTGVSFREFTGELTKERKRKIKLLTIFHSLSFISGFSIVFVLLGASVTFLGKLLLQHQVLLKRAGGLLIIFLALVIMGVIKAPFLMKEKKLSYKKEGVSILGSLLVGATFAIAWTPCVGPILGSILIYTSSSASVKMGIKLLTGFSLGFGLPFFLSALAINSFLAYIKRIEKYLRWVTVAAGAVLIIFGILLSANAETRTSGYGKAMDFRLEDINGDIFSLSEYSGKVIILNFFATWCAPCRMEMPGFNRIQAEYKDDVKVIAVNIGGESLSRVRKFADANKLIFTVAIDDGSVGNLYGPIRAIPVTVIIDKKFDIVKKYIGMRTKKAFVRDIDELLQ